MSGFWTILGLEPTRDVSAIKRAYAEKARTCHPEEDPEGFLALRRAYETALNYAESGQTQPPAFPIEPPARGGGWGGPPTDREEESQEAEPQAPPNPPEPDGWYLLDEEPEIAANPYADGEAIDRFLKLYTGKQRRDSKRWMDYFTSDAFLAAGWDSRFTALLLEKVTEAERELPPNKEFLMWLCTAYQFSVKAERRVELYPGAEFDGIEPILRIAAKGPLPSGPAATSWPCWRALKTTDIWYAWQKVGLGTTRRWRNIWAS